MVLKAALNGINLTAHERQSLPRISDNTVAFEEKCASYTASRAELVPSFRDTAEMAKSHTPRESASSPQRLHPRPRCGCFTCC
jgi:hypothetical protein